MAKVASGTNANLTGMFQGCSTFEGETPKVTYALTDVGTGTGAKLSSLVSGAFASELDPDSAFKMERTTARTRSGDMAGAFDAGEAPSPTCPHSTCRGSRTRPREHHPRQALPQPGGHLLGGGSEVREVGIRARHAGV